MTSAAADVRAIHAGESVCIVIPCFNEAARLDFAHLAADRTDATYVFVNDGSSDATVDRIREHVSERIFLCNLERNVGKGEAIRQGFAFARRTGLLDHAEWFGYWDADMSTPLTELEHFFAYARLYDLDRVDGIFRNRILRLGHRIKSSEIRE